jgi:Domain of unknown function (DUF4276)
VSAFPELLRRLIAAAAVTGVEVARPIRRHRPELVHEEKLKTTIGLARAQPDCGAILILFDGDDDCPKELMSRLRPWAVAAAGSTPCEIVIAHREYEAWFLCAVESLRGLRGIDSTATSHTEPETIRDAKGALEKRMTPPNGYAETTDQVALSARFDMAAAYRASRSFRRLARAFALVIRGAGVLMPLWPPKDWSSVTCVRKKVAQIDDLPRDREADFRDSTDTADVIHKLVVDWKR